MTLPHVLVKVSVCCVLPKTRVSLHLSNRCSPLSNVPQPCSVCVFTEAGEGGLQILFPQFSFLPPPSGDSS